MKTIKFEINLKEEYLQYAHPMAMHHLAEAIQQIVNRNFRSLILEITHDQPSPNKKGLPE